MTGLDALAIDMRSLAAKLGGDGARRLTTAACVAGKKAALDALKADLPSQRLSHLGRKGTKLAVGYDLIDDTTAEVKLRPRGAWVLLEKGARRHAIGVKPRRPKKGQKKHRRRMDFGTNPNDPKGGSHVSGPIDHPGAPVKKTLTEAVAAIAKAIPPAVATELAKVIDGG